MRQRRHQWPAVFVFFTLATLSVTAVSCDARPPEEPLVSDSAGIVIVENGILDSAATASRWTLASAPNWQVGRESVPEGQFLGVVGATLLDDGALLVASGRLNEVVRFDFAVGSRATLGGVGQGPKEFSRVRGLFRCAGDTVVVDDFSRLLVFDGGGHHVRTTPVTVGEGTFRAEGISFDCRKLLVYTSDYQMPPPRQSGRVTGRLRWQLIDDGSESFITSVAAFEVVNDVSQGGSQPIFVPWGMRTRWATDGRLVYVGATDRPEVKVYDDGTVIRIIRWHRDPGSVGRNERRYYGETREEWLDEVPPLRVVMPPWGYYPEIPERKPYFDRLLVDAVGNLWLRTYSPNIAGRTDLFGFGGPVWRGADRGIPNRWFVFARDGRLAATIDVPSSWHIVEISGSSLLVVGADEVDAEYVAEVSIDKQRR